MADESEDLYGDIDESAVFPVSATKNSAQSALSASTVSAATASAHLKNPSHHPRPLVEEVAFLQDKVTKLEKENEVLKRNMGILFRTATAEIQRKDKEILRLVSGR